MQHVWVARPGVHMLWALACQGDGATCKAVGHAASAGGTDISVQLSLSLLDSSITPLQQDQAPHTTLQAYSHCQHTEVVQRSRLLLQGFLMRL